MKLNRREFLKLAALYSASTFIKPSLNMWPTAQLKNSNTPNILIFVLDALSAHNISLYGYPRQTMPNLDRLLNRATVYHQHYAASNFTTTGTASLLTGVNPWNHRALTLNDSTAPEFATKNIFSLFDQYYRVAYTHNPIAEVLLNQFNNEITFHKLWVELYLHGTTSWWGNELFNNDYDTATLSWMRTMNPNIDGFTYSLLLSKILNKDNNNISADLKDLFPRGLPEGQAPNLYLLEQAADWVQSQVANLPEPFMGYFHFYPPHEPYNTRRDFIDQFKDDGYQPLEKAPHPLTPKAKRPQEDLNQNRQYYDEYILYADHEFRNIYEYLDREGILENTWIILTSDHGETFERGYTGHGSLLYQPLVRIPLIIFEPGQKARKDIYDPTSCLDLIPTLLKVTDQPIPNWLEGEILPPYRDKEPKPGRDIYAYYGWKNPTQFGALETGTLMLVKDQLKALRYFGYTNAYTYEIEMETDPLYEVFDLENDPEELNNLAKSGSKAVKSIIQEMEDKYHEVSKPYQGQLD